MKKMIVIVLFLLLVVNVFAGDGVIDGHDWINWTREKKVAFTLGVLEASHVLSPEVFAEYEFNENELLFIVDALDMYYADENNRYFDVMLNVGMAWLAIHHEEEE